MPGGVFQTDRAIFDNPIWKNPAKFRLFFYIYGNAVFSKDGLDIGGIHLGRGQLLKSYRNLSDELEYLENHSLKRYSISHIKKMIDELVDEKKIQMEISPLGTVFTVLNYEQYQGFERFEKDNREHCENTERTLKERRKNNNNKDNKDNNENNKERKSKERKNNIAKKYYGEKVKMYEEEFFKLESRIGKDALEALILKMELYLKASGKSYKCYYSALCQWIIRDADRSNNSTKRAEYPGNKILMLMPDGAIEKKEKEMGKSYVGVGKTQKGESVWKEL